MKGKCLNFVVDCIYTAGQDKVFATMLAGAILLVSGLGLLFILHYNIAGSIAAAGAVMMGAAIFLDARQRGL